MPEAYDRAILIDGGAHKGQTFKHCLDEDLNVLVDNKTGHPYFEIPDLRGGLIQLYEPNPLMQEKLNIIADKFPPGTVEVHNEAIWITTGGMDLYKCDHTTLGHSVIHGFNGAMDTLAQVKCTDVVDIVSMLSPKNYNILKLDIEGAEYPVMSRLVGDSCFTLIREVHIEWHAVRANKLTQISIIKACEDKGVLYKPWLH